MNRALLFGCLTLALTAVGSALGQTDDLGLQRLPPPHETEADLRQSGMWPGADTDGTSRASQASWLQESSSANLQLAPPDQQRVGVTDHKEGVFQALGFTGTWLGEGGADDLGMTDIEMYATWAFPAPRRESPLVITPGYGVHYLSGPAAPDLPARVHDVYVSFLWMNKINDRWGVQLGFTPGVYSDFQQVTGDAWRYTGRALVSYDCVPDCLQLIGGVVYLDRDDVSVLPALGVIYTPDDDSRYELVFPRPKLAHRFAYYGAAEDWWYMGAEFGGGSWQIERASGALDTVTIRDYRLLLGWERKLNGGASRRIEVGWVFGRAVEYASATPDIEPGDTFLIRAGIVF